MLLKCQNLSLGYNGRIITKNINFELCRGDYLCIVGENGSGKSTLIKTLLHLNTPISGEITEDPITTEDGLEESTMIVTGFHRGKRIDLEKDKEKIKEHFDPIYGLRGETEKGAIIVFYDGAFYIPSGEASLLKIQINLKIKEWKGA